MVAEGAEGGAALACLLPVGGQLAEGEALAWRFVIAAPEASAAPRILARPTRPPRDDVLTRAVAAPPLPPSHRAAITRFLEDPEHGFLWAGADAGDWVDRAQGRGNAEYDTGLALLLAGLNAGRDDWIAHAEATTWHQHTRDLDVAGRGWLHPHGEGHRTEASEPGHHWQEGAHRFSWWGDDRLFEEHLAAARERRALAASSWDLGKARPRELGWGLLTLAEDLSEAPDHRALKAALRRVRGHLLDHLGPDGQPQLTRAAGGGHQYQPFVLGGIIVPALARSLEVAPDAKGRAALQRLVRHLEATAAHDHALHGWTLARRVHLPRGRGRTGRSGAASFEEQHLFLAGLGRARGGRPPAGDLRRLRRALDARTDFGQRKELGRSLSLVLRSWPDL